MQTKVAKNKNENIHASKKENEKSKKSKTKDIHADIFAARDHLDVKIA